MIAKIQRKLNQIWVGLILATLNDASRQEVVSRISDENPGVILEAFGPKLNRKPNLDNMPQDLPQSEGVMTEFENFAGLFASTSLDHAVIAMTIRQCAYLFGMTRQMNARKVIEIGRYKGGSAVLLAAAMHGEGTLWSLDIGKKETRLENQSRKYDDQLRDKLKALNLSNVEIILGDSRTYELDTGGDVDLVFIDGDHTYEGVKNDFDRFGRMVRVGGAVMFDDANQDGVFDSHSDTVGRVVKEATETGDYRLVKFVNRLAHLERVR